MKKLIALLVLLASSCSPVYAGEPLMLRADNGAGTVVTVTSEQCVDRMILRTISRFNTVLTANGLPALDANTARQGTVEYDGAIHSACWVFLPDGAAVFTEQLEPFAVPASAFVKVDPV